MQRTIWIFLTTIFIFFCADSTFARPGESYLVESQCDLADVNLSSQKAKTTEECSAACQKSSKCGAFVYVSGWNRCFLKSSAKKKTKIRFYAADIEKGAGKTAVAKGGGYDQDHSGKDLERKVTSTPKSCEKACLSREDCRAFTFIEGYDVCWLKAAGGRLLPKIFYCGIPKS